MTTQQNENIVISIFTLETYEKQKTESWIKIQGMPN